jgi:hypothetical protein
MHDSNKLVRNGDLIWDRIHCGDLENNSCVITHAMSQIVKEDWN